MVWFLIWFCAPPSEPQASRRAAVTGAGLCCPLPLLQNFQTKLPKRKEKFWAFCVRRTCFALPAATARARRRRASVSTIFVAADLPGVTIIIGARAALPSIFVFLFVSLLWRLRRIAYLSTPARNINAHSTRLALAGQRASCLRTRRRHGGELSPIKRNGGLPTISGNALGKYHQRQRGIIGVMKTNISSKA